VNTLLVGYDLNRPGQDYEALLSQLREFGTWWHHLDSVWLVRTELTAVQLRNELKPLTDVGDEILVIDVTGKSWAGTGFSDRAFDWMQKNL
jgi:hypothetical protein